MADAAAVTGREGLPVMRATVCRLDGVPCLSMRVTGFEKIISEAKDSKRLTQLTEVPSPPPHERVYDLPAAIAAGVMVKAMGELWARAATTIDAPTKRVLVKCMLILMAAWQAIVVGLNESDSDEVIRVKSALSQM